MRELGKLGGWCDGSIDRAAVFTVPVRAGFVPVERAMDAAIAAHPAFVSYYGNVYGEDGKTPLGWWRAFLEPE